MLTLHKFTEIQAGDRLRLLTDPEVHRHAGWRGFQKEDADHRFLRLRMMRP